MERFFRNKYRRLSHIESNIIFSFIIASSIGTFVLAHSYIENQIVAILNCIDLAAVAVLSVILMQHKFRYSIDQNSFPWIALCTFKISMVPTFMMVLSEFIVGVDMYYFSSLVFFLMSFPIRNSVFYLSIGTVGGLVLVNFSQSFLSLEVVGNYKLALQDIRYIVTLIIISTTAVLFLCYYRSIEFIIKTTSMRTFSNVVANEVFTSLAFIEAMVGILEYQSDSAERENMVKNLLRTCRTTRASIELILQNLNLIGSVHKFNHVKQSLKKVIDDFLEESEIGFISKFKISFIAHNDIVFTGSNQMVKCVIFNILKNILQHSKGDLRVEMCISGENLIIQDNGCGIKKPLLPEIFSSFTTSTECNLGIGLAVCKEIMKSHGGDISCISLEGTHTTFILKFQREP